MSLRRSSSTKPATVLAMLLSTVAAATVTLIGGPADQPTMMLDGREVAAKEVLVKFASGFHEANSLTVQSQSDADRDTAVGRFGLRRIHSRTFDTATLLSYLNSQPDVVYAEPNYIVHSTAVPNDPNFGVLWGLQNLGQAISGIPGLSGADIHATSAWDVTTGSTANVLAVIDTGVDYTHPDLAANIWSAPTSYTVNLNGTSVTCAAGTHGINVMTKVCNPMDDHNHGTHVSGTIGAVGNNGQGVAGVNWTARIMGVKFLDNTGSGSLADAITGMDFAIQAKALTGANVRILSNSWGGGGYSQAMLDEINLTGANNMLFVVAAGNSGQNIDITATYPAAYSPLAPSILAVSATDNLDALAYFSNYGPTRVHVGAPGNNIYSTLIGGGYGYMSGTSMATPHTSGAALLLLAACPSLDTAGLKANLIANVDPTLAGWVSSGGRINLARSIAACSGGGGGTTRIIGVSGSLAFGTVPVGTSPTSTLTISNSGNSALTVTSITYPTGFSGSWSGTIPSSGSQPVTVTFTPTSATTYSGTVTVNANQTSGTNTISASGTGSCSFSISPTSASVAASSGSGSFSVTTAGSCGWTASTGTSWVHTTSTGAGSGSVSYTVDANTGASRSGSITVQGNTFTINQAAGSSCSYSLSPTSTSVSSGATSGTFGVTTTAGCAWSAAPGASWLHSTSSSTGSGTVSYTVDANTGAARSGSITVQGITFTVNQAAAPTCSYSLSPPSTSVSSAATSGSFSVTTTTGCAWSAAPGASWLHTTSSGSASGTVAYTVDANTGSNRTGTITVAGNAFTVSQGAAVPSVSVSPTTASAGAIITAVITNGPGNINDWVGLYSTSAGDSSYTSWKYLTDSYATPTTGLTTATVHFIAPSTGGTYNIRFFAAGLFTKLATSATITISAPAAPAVTPALTTVAAGAPIVFTVTNGPGSTSDWVGLYNTSADDGAYTAWEYLSGSYSMPATGLTSATIQFTAPSTAGTYNIRFFASGLFTKLATSATITVTGGLAPTVTPTATTVSSGAPIVFSIANGPGALNDWVGLYAVSGADGAYLAWSYLNGTYSMPSSGITAATLVFPAPATGGSYELRFFANGGFTRLATSVAITVVAPTPTVTASATTVTAGSAFNAIVAGGPGSVSDWVGVYLTTAGDGGYQAWFYLNGTHSLPATGLTSATLAFTAPTAPGTYELRFFASGGFTRLATSAPITVVAGAPPSLTPSATTVSHGAPFTVTVANGPGANNDWVGLYSTAATDASYNTWKYLSDSTTLPATGVTTAVLHFTAPTTAGTYNLRFFANGGFAKLATSVTITVP